MKKILILLTILLIPTICFASPPARVATYTSGQVISSTDVTANEDAIFNYLSAGVDSYSDGSILNADIGASANIQSDKLNLTSIAQAVTVTSGGSFTSAGTNTLSGSTTISGSLSVTNSATFSGITIASLGTVTTGVITEIDLNGGSIDGTTIGQTSPTAGRFSNIRFNSAVPNSIVYDSDAGLTRLAPGTSGQYLKANGAGSAPSFASPGWAWEFVETVTLTGSGVSSSTLPTNSDVFMIVFEDAVSDTGGLHMTFNSTGAGYDYMTIATTTLASTAGAGIVELTAVNDVVSGSLLFYRVANSDGSHGITGNLNIETIADRVFFYKGSWNNVAAITTVDFLSQSGNLAGSVHIFKLTKQV